jgi:hypothetical protein
MGFLTAIPEAAWSALTSTREISYTRKQIILWWEHRRIYYNLMLLIAGVASIMGIEWVGGIDLPPGEDVIEPMALFVAVLMFAMCANFCYTFGTIFDLRHENDRPSVKLLVGGYLFSILVTLTPFLLVTLAFVLRRLRQ